MMKTAFSRRLLAILLVAAMCLSVIPAMVFAADPSVTLTPVSSATGNQKVIYGGKTLDTKAMKIGTSSKGGSFTITVPAGSTGLSFYAGSWKGAGSIQATLSWGTEERTIDLNEDVGFTSSSPYTMTNDPNGEEPNYKFTVTFDAALKEETKVTVSTVAAQKRAVFFCISAITGCTHENATSVTTDPTCDKPGVKTYTCPACNETWTEEIPATGAHNDADGDGLCDACSVDMSSPFTQITADTDLVSGKYVLVASDGSNAYAPSHYDGGWVYSVSPTVTDGKLVDAMNAFWTLTVDNGTVKLQDINGKFIKPSSETNSGITEGEYSWKFTFNKDTKTFQFLGTEGNVALKCNTDSGHKFRAYSTTNKYPADFTLYKLDLNGKVVMDQVNATLGGQFGLNYFVNIPDSLKNTASVRITVAGKEAQVKSIKDMTPDAKGRYEFTCLLNANQMHDQVAFEVFNGDKAVTLYDKNGNATTSFTYQLADYFQTLSDNNKDTTTGTLAQAALTYGHFSEIALDKTAEPGDNTSVKDVTSKTPELEACKKVPGGTRPAGLTSLQMTLSLEEETTIHLMFKVDKLENYTIEITNTVTGSKVSFEPRQDTNGVWHIEIPNIAAPNLNDLYRLVIKENASGTACQLDFSALSYAYDAVLKAEAAGASKEVIKAADAARALYKYYVAADAYFNPPTV